ncbi:hypothetical protein XA68_10263 [Ophiocordyceps unilateralis]|uniref:Uncharacterized protein n=1 Tax=Ophiocordyceps unilateralis TaxID=268505 RepID=A0A2A9P310_OPHUN|nr:hypothetical protein XA68_10263 [Ophiocordyceps unilateralis]
MAGKSRKTNGLFVRNASYQQRKTKRQPLHHATIQLLRQRFAVRAEIALASFDKETFSLRDVLRGQDFRSWVSRLRRKAQAAYKTPIDLAIHIWPKIDVYLRENLVRPTGYEDFDDWVGTVEAILPSIQAKFTDGTLAHIGRTEEDDSIHSPSDSALLAADDPSTHETHRNWNHRTPPVMGFAIGSALALSQGVRITQEEEQHSNRRVDSARDGRSSRM